MYVFERPWEFWLRMIDVLRERSIDYMLQAADYIQAHLDETPADQAMVRIAFRDEMYYRSIFGASLELGDKLLLDYS